MTEIKAFAHQLLGTAIDEQDLTIKEIASACNMDEKTTARIIEYLKGKNYIKDIEYHNPEDICPVTFVITTTGYDWVEEMDKQNKGKA